MIYCAGKTPASRYAKQQLFQSGLSISDAPCWNTNHLLLDVPSFQPGLWSEEELDTLLSSLPRDLIIWGGNLCHDKLSNYRTVDLLTDESYLTDNAALTADCVIPLAESALKQPWERSSVLLIGWGRITKALSGKLRSLNAHVSIASGTPHHHKDAAAAGFPVLASSCLENSIRNFHLIINTAPAPVLTLKEPCPTVLMDLASVKGIDAPDVIWARALPGKYAPECSGKLIADAVIRQIREVSP